MEIVKQITVFMENKPGVLARVWEHLAEKGIRILSYTVIEATDHGVVRMLVDEPTHALHALGEAGMLVTGADVISIEVGAEPGALAGIARRLADAGINIHYSYGTVGVEGGRVVLKPSDLDRARSVIGGRHAP